MRKQAEKEVTITEYETVEFGCNRCGKLEQNADSFTENGFHNFGVNFGYGSKYDTDQWEFDLCEDCLFEVVKDFKVAPSGFMIDSYEYVEDYEKTSQENFLRWKSEGK